MSRSGKKITMIIIETLFTIKCHIYLDEGNKMMSF